MLICPQCKAQNPDNSSRCVSCMASMARALPGPPGPPGAAPAPGAATLAGGGSGNDSMLMGVILSAVGAALGVVAWIIVARVFDWEARFMIVVIGGFAGIGMILGARAACSTVTGVIAAAFTIAGLLGGNWIKSSLDLEAARSEMIAEATTPEALTQRIAVSIYTERQKQAPDDEDEEGDEEIDAEAKKRWDAMPADEKERLANAARREIDEQAHEWGASLGFFAVFRSIWGIGWTIMAVGLAFRAGAQRTG